MRNSSNIANELSEQTKNDYPLFAEYCNLLDKGIRKVALKYLDAFLEITKNWDFTTKAIFCKQVFNASKSDNDLDIVLTTNLSDKLIKPTLLEMTLVEPENFLPFKWYGLYFHDTIFLKKAYEINPSDNSTKLNLLRRLENDLWLSTHHLPEAYLGDYTEDENDINLAFSILATFDKIAEENYTKLFSHFRDDINNYIMTYSFKN